MRKIIVIGESVLDTFFHNGQPVRSVVGGRIANAAASLGMVGLPVTMCSECCADKVGNIIVKFLEDHHVDTKSVDRYTDGSTSVSMIFEEDGGTSYVNYGVYPDTRFDVVWPRIDENDIIVFGSLYSVDAPQRERLFDLVTYAVERKAIVMYLPGFQHGLNFRITRVMTAILENLEISSLVVAHDRDLANIFPGETAEEAYHNHIEYYCPVYCHIHANQSVTVMVEDRKYEVACPDAVHDNWLGWQSGFTAGLVYQLLLQGITIDMLSSLDQETAQTVVRGAFEFARVAAQMPDNSVDAAFGAKQLQALKERRQQDGTEE